MNTIEHLKLIRAWCVNALENVASKRTPGEWTQGDDNHESIVIRGTGERSYSLRWNNGQGPNDAAFIAACAGRAEAGWKTTIEAIDLLRALHGMNGLNICELDATKNILAAWPLELITQNQQA